MRADWTACGACISGSTAHPRGATRRASGGAATTSTTRAERSRGCRGATAGLQISRRMASERLNPPATALASREPSLSPSTNGRIGVESYLTRPLLRRIVASVEGLAWHPTRAEVFLKRTRGVATVTSGRDARLRDDIGQRGEKDGRAERRGDFPVQRHERG